MDFRLQVQRNPVADEVSALVAVVRPILIGLLYGLKAEVAAEVGGTEIVKLKMLNRLRRPGDGDLGICFEYAVHDAIRRQEQMVVERVDDALTDCAAFLATTWTRFCSLREDRLRAADRHGPRACHSPSPA